MSTRFWLTLPVVLLTRHEAAVPRGLDTDTDVLKSYILGSTSMAVHFSTLAAIAAQDVERCVCAAQLPLDGSAGCGVSPLRTFNCSELHLRSLPMSSAMEPMLPGQRS